MSILDWAGAFGPMPDDYDPVREQRRARGWTEEEIAEAEDGEAP